MVIADLHVHTTNSDGQLSFADLPAAAKEAGLEVIAVTDHDRIHPQIDAPVIVRDGVTIIHGIELRVQADDLRVDLLGLGVSPTTELQAECDRLGADRIQRAQSIIACIEQRLNVKLNIELSEKVGRPHIARAVVEHAETVYETEQAVFDELIGRDCPCYRSRSVPTFEQGVALLKDACAIVGLAHPFRYSDPQAALKLAVELDGVEREYPYDSSVDVSEVDEMINDYELLALGGSDAHGKRLGKTGLTAKQYATVAERLPDSN